MCRRTLKQGITMAINGFLDTYPSSAQYSSLLPAKTESVADPFSKTAQWHFHTSLKRNAKLLAGQFVDITPFARWGIDQDGTKIIHVGQGGASDHRVGEGLEEPVSVIVGQRITGFEAQ